MKKQIWREEQRGEMNREVFRLALGGAELKPR